MLMNTWQFIRQIGKGWVLYVWAISISYVYTECRISLKRKFKSEHVSHKNQGPKIYSLEGRKP